MMKKYLLFSTSQIYTDNPTGGIRRYRELCEYINKVDDAIICSFDETTDMISLGYNHVHINEGKNIGLYKILPPIFRIFYQNRRIISQLRKNGYDKIVVFDTAPTFALAVWGFRHITMLIRKDVFEYEKVSSRSIILFRYLKLTMLWVWEIVCLLSVDKIITQCAFDRDILKSRHPILASVVDKKTQIQINNVNPSWIVRKSSEVSSEVQLGSHNSFRICFIGGFDDARKGQDFFLETAQTLLRKGEEFEFVLVGGGSNLSKYKDLYKHRSILFCGRLQNPLSVLKECDLLVVPSLADSCPNTVMEALYNEILVLGSKRGGIPEILKDEESLFDLDKNELVHKILNIKNDEVTKDN